ncbi:MAG TPA: DJ-1 family glyoxalase III, partial [Candidatus Bathyarchaeia archaeon]|nr:DJ-1 family glyoxalase III [Candidatus Bathyarchaeia archaeon]
MNKKVLIILADGFEEIEAIAVIDILRRCSIEVRTASLSGQTLVTGGHQISIQADILLKDIRTDFDACVLPGGSAGAQHLADSDLVHSLIAVMHQANKIIAAICAAPAKVLSPTGVLDGRKATCYPGMQKFFPSSSTYLEDA